MRVLRRGVLPVVVALGAVGAGPAHAATTLGATFDPLFTCSAGFTFVQTPDPAGTSYAVASRGVITSWQFRAPPLSVPQIEFKVFRPAGSGMFLVVHSGAAVTPGPGTQSSFPVRLPVEAGDRIGMATLTPGKCGGSGSVAKVAGDSAVGSTLSYGMGIGDLDLSAVVEADSDGDGFGDETQDLCASQKATQGACDLLYPQSDVTKGPQPSDRRRTSATFRFVSDEPGSTFECRLKGKHVRTALLQEFRPCTSPKTYKNLLNGDYKFQVRATDVAGNRERTPSHWKFRVRRR